MLFLSDMEMKQTMYVPALMTLCFSEHGASDWPAHYYFSTRLYVMCTDEQQTPAIQICEVVSIYSCVCAFVAPLTIFRPHIF